MKFSLFKEELTIDDVSLMQDAQALFMTSSSLKRLPTVNPPYIEILAALMREVNKNITPYLIQATKESYQPEYKWVHIRGPRICLRKHIPGIRLRMHHFLMMCSDDY